MWHRYAKRKIGWLCPSSSRCKKVRGQPQRDRGRASDTICTCEEIKRGTHAQERQSWGPSNSGGLRMVHWESQSKTLPQGPEDGHIYRIWLIRIVFCHVSDHFIVCFTSLWTFISVFYVHSVRDVVTVLLIFAKYLSFYLHIFTYIHRGTHTQAHMYNQHTRGMVTTRHRSWLRGAEERLC